MKTITFLIFVKRRSYGNDRTKVIVFHVIEIIVIIEKNHKMRR